MWKCIMRVCVCVCVSDVIGKFEKCFKWMNDILIADQHRNEKKNEMHQCQLQNHIYNLFRNYTFSCWKDLLMSTNTQKKNIGIKKHYEINSVCMFTKIKFFASISFRASQIWCFIMVLFLFLFLYFTFHILHFTIYREKEILLPLSRSLIHISSNWKIN